MYIYLYLYKHISLEIFFHNIACLFISAVWQGMHSFSLLNVVVHDRFLKNLIHFITIVDIVDACYI